MLYNTTANRTQTVFTTLTSFTTTSTSITAFNTSTFIDVATATVSPTTTIDGTTTTTFTTDVATVTDVETSVVTSTSYSDVLNTLTTVIAKRSAAPAKPTYAASCTPIGTTITVYAATPTVTAIANLTSTLTSLATSIYTYTNTSTISQTLTLNSTIIQSTSTTTTISATQTTTTTITDGVTASQTTTTSTTTTSIALASATASLFYLQASVPGSASNGLYLNYYKYTGIQEGYGQFGQFSSAALCTLDGNSHLVCNGFVADQEAGRGVVYFDDQARQVSGGLSPLTCSFVDGILACQPHLGFTTTYACGSSFYFAAAATSSSCLQVALKPIFVS